MKRFQFQFSSILKVRKMREDEALRALGAAQQALAGTKAEKSALEASLGEAFGRRERLGTSPTTIYSFQLEQDFIDGQKRRIDRQDQLIIRAQRSVEKAFRTYLTARRQAEMMERLRQRHFEAFRRERAKKEQKELDDLSVMRHRLVEQERGDDAEADLGLETALMSGDAFRNAGNAKKGGAA